MKKITKYLLIVCMAGLVGIPIQAQPTVTKTKELYNPGKYNYVAITDSNETVEYGGSPSDDIGRWEPYYAGDEESLSSLHSSAAQCSFKVPPQRKV